ncbi:MAG TPA: CHRD domain-containing protein [Phycisphaerales bacterium]|nr:CHRD domain-containing protein [Phycisphaerales bacterium]
MRLAIRPLLFLLAVAPCSAHAHTWHYYFGLSAAQVTTGSQSPHRGSAILHYNHHNLRADLDLFISGLTLDDLLPHGPNGTPIHFHMGRILEEGPIVTDLGWLGDFVQEQNGIRLTLSQVYLAGQQGEIYSDFGDVEYALYNNSIYAQVYTKAYPLGELRGQIYDRRGFGPLGNPTFNNDFEVIGPVPAPATSALLLSLAATIRRRRP